MREVTKKQHFVPKFYLKRFAGADGSLQVLDLKSKRIVKPVPYASVCWSKFFYSAEEGEFDEGSQEFEQMFERIENAISKDWDELLQRAIGESLRPEDFLHLTQFVAMLMLRTRANRDNFNRNMEAIDKAQYGMLMRHENFDNPQTVEKFRKIVGVDVSVEELKEMQSTIVKGEFTLSYNNVRFLRFVVSQFEGFCNVVVTGRWTVYRTSGNLQFITSENPVVEWAPKRTDFYGTARLAHVQYIALSPEIMIKIEPPPIPDPFPEPEDEFPLFPMASETVRYRQSSDIDVNVYDFLLTGQGTSFSYANRSRELAKMIQGHRNRDPAHGIYSAAFANY